MNVVSFLNWRVWALASFGTFDPIPSEVTPSMLKRGAPGWDWSTPAMPSWALAL